jgi:7,8-dihydropterin-6-yl-methyl-4-(beta-D-ribofuranosyl)aminobenzene 5'-phosphate synthase
MKISVVVDNCSPINARKPFISEHGLSLLIEHSGKKILLDTGQNMACVLNLSIMGIHASQIDMISLSHGHYDHAGGIIHVLQHAAKRMPVHAHPKVFEPRFSVSGEKRSFVGIPYVKEHLTQLGADWQLSDKPAELLPGLWFSGGIPRQSGFESGDTRLVVCTADGCDCPDHIADDTSIFFSGPNGLVVISGCSHSGLVNTVRYGLKLTGASRLAGWIGGTHLGPVSADQQEKTIDELESMNPDFIAANHCTGFVMMSKLRERFGSRFIPAFTGTVIEA